MFVGQQQTVVDCISCEHKSKTYLPFLEIVLTIVGMSSIENCLDNYYETEKLQDLYECENCKKKTKAVKSTCITKAPNYLMIVLGKFQSATQKKIEDRIDYGLELNIKKYCFGHCGDTTYLLQSMIIHKGAKRNKGHYYTLARRGPKNVNTCLFRTGSISTMEASSRLRIRMCWGATPTSSYMNGSRMHEFN